ncbi:MAG TPA: hypothetical protein VLV54_19975 [Thermoanaerobaculia bacterium]|nr:hypothetical protein [Thermoanaerobaculia bacterium]
MKKRVSILTAAILLAVFTGALPGAAQKPAEPEASALLISGDGFSFMVQEPPGWTGDTDKARTYGVSVVFFPSAAASKAADVTIRVRVDEKTHENLEEDLKTDLNGLRQRYPELKSADLDVQHPGYATFPKLFYMPGSFFEYVAYLNPGPQFPFSVAVAMSKAKSAASPGELAAFASVLKSINVLSGAQQP